MEFREILAKRRMHRAFLPDPIPDDQIERIVGVIRRPTDELVHWQRW